MPNAIRKPMFCLVPVLAGLFSFTPARAAVLLEQYGQCRLEDHNGLIVLRLRGTPEEMGYAHGRLLAAEARTVYQNLIRSLAYTMHESEQGLVAAEARPHIPDRFVREIQEIAHGINDELGEPNAVSADRLLELHSWDEIIRGRLDRGLCVHFAALGGATQDGHVLLAVDNVDEVSVMKGVQDGAVVIVYEPEGGHTFCTASWAGFAGVMVGMNAQGLSISKARCPSSDQSGDGLPAPFQLRRVLEETANVGAAEALLKSVPRTISGNILVADGVGTSSIRAFEYSHGRFGTFTEGDPDEEHTYTIEKKAVLVTVTYEGIPPIDLQLPFLNDDIVATISQPLPNAIVRANSLSHHKGSSPLLGLHTNWLMEYMANDDDFDFIDISSMAVDYPFPSLNVLYIASKIMAGEARELILPILGDILDSIYPYWEQDLYFPHLASPARYSAVWDRVNTNLGTIDASKAINILGGGGATGVPNVLMDPNSLQSVVIDATAMEMWVATALPKGSAGKPDAKLQTYRKLDFASLASYPLTVKTTPVSGEVFIDGESWGQAPQTQHIAPGQYVVSFGEVDGYATPPDQIVTVGLDGASVTGEYEVKHDLDITTDGQGTVSLTPPGGQYVSGTKVTLEATPAEGWYFVEWSGDASGTSPTTVVTVNGDTQVTAHFAEIPAETYSLTVDVEGQGTVDPSGGTYEEGTTETLKATPAAGWRFSHWEQDAEGTHPQIQITFDSNKTVKAVFVQGDHLLTVNIDGQGSVDPPGGGYDTNDVVTLHATPAAGWRFVGWSGDVTSSQASVTLTIVQDTTVTARFEALNPNTYSLTVHIEGQGTVQPSSGAYAKGDVVALLAAPAEGWHFVEWSGDASGDELTTAVTINGDTTVTARFEPGAPVQYTLTVQIEGQGSVEPSGGTYEEGEQVSLKATPAEGWYFAGWSGDASGEQASTTITIVGDTTVTARFEALAAKAYALTIHVEGQGTVEPPGGVYEAGDTVSLVATPAEGWHFVEWSGGATGSQPTTTLTIQDDTIVTARFEENPPGACTLTLLVEGEGSVQPSGGMCQEGDVITLHATPSPGWHFVEWAGGASGDQASARITMAGDTTVTARFAANGAGEHALTIHVEGKGVVSPSSGAYEAGKSVTLRAAAEEGWHFVGWSGDIISDQPAVVVTIDGDTTVTAEFEADPPQEYSLTVQVEGEGSIEISGGPYVEGAVVTLNAVPEPGWHFASWSGDASGSQASVSITIVKDTVVTARFEANPPEEYALTVHIQGEGSVEPAGGKYEEGDIVQLLATPATGWRFGGWSGDVTSDEAGIAITMNGPKTVTAKFDPPTTYALTVQVEGDGLVEPNGGNYQAGQVVRLYAIPEEGSRFVGWSGAATGDQPTTEITIERNMTVTARFERDLPNTYALTVQIEGQGTVEPGSGVYSEGDQVTLTAEPAEHWEFVGWTGDVESADPVIHFSIHGDKAVRAVFRELFQVVLDVEIQGQGQVTLNPPGGTYAPGTEVTLQAKPGADKVFVAWEFIKWQGDIEAEDNPVTVVLNSNKHVVAVFSQKYEELPEVTCCTTSAAPVLGALLVGGMLLATRRRQGAGPFRSP